MIKHGSKKITVLLDFLVMWHWFALSGCVNSCSAENHLALDDVKAAACIYLEILS
jgi:hypothetical protein